MKHDSKVSYLKDAEPTQQPDLLPMHERALTQLGQSIGQANELFVAWLEALGTASVGLSDEHVAPEKRRKDLG